MQRAKDLDELAAAADLIQFVPDISQHDELGGIYKQKRGVQAK